MKNELGIEGQTHPFSIHWALAAVVIYTAMEIGIAVFLAPAILAGRLASPMLQMRIQMLMHLASFFVGGIFVGVISPGVRLVEPAVGAFFAVAIVFMMSFFMPSWFMHWSTSKVMVGGGIAFALALGGAYTGEKWMGNVVEGGKGKRRANVRKELWGNDGLMVPKHSVPKHGTLLNQDHSLIDE